MYLKFFNLNKEPFQITPDPSFLYLSHVHKEALASIVYGVEKRKGFVLITGAVGVGKTTVLRAYLEKADNEKLRIIYVFNANIAYKNLLKYVFMDLGEAPESNDVCDMVNQLHKILINEYRQGRNILLLIDEAQNMPVDTLESLRMLSNLETATEKLIQIVFSAQPEFEKTLNMEELKQLRQRIAVKAVISPLSRDEGITYIHHRLKTASNKESIIFTDYAIKEIVQVAKGIPRVINVLCDNCLITAFGYGKKKIGIGVVKEITRDFGMQRPLYVRCRVYLLIGALAIIGVLSIKNMNTFFSGKSVLPLQAISIPPRETKPSETEVNNQGNGKKSVKKVVQRGDTLAKLVKNIYGRVDATILREVKDANPKIYNEDLIIEGSVVIFPFKEDD